MLTREQIQKNIEAFEEQGASQGEIQGWINSLPKPQEQPQEQRVSGASGLPGFASGFTKWTAGTIVGASRIGEKILQAPLKLFGAKFPDRTAGEVLQGLAEESLGMEPGEMTTPISTAEKVGDFAGSVAGFAIPASKAGSAARLAGMGKVGQVGARAAASGASATLQSGRVGAETAIATGAELIMPGLSKIASTPLKMTGRLMSSLGSGLSGVAQSTLKKIAKSPKTAIEASKKILSEGQEAILRKNANIILDGVAKIRQEAGQMYRSGLEKLSTIDIKVPILRKNISEALKNNNIKILKDGVDFTPSEIMDKVIIKRARGLINEINSLTKASGKEIRSMLDRLESSKFKSALDPNRQAYNNLVNDLMKGLRKSINESTDKLKEIDLKYHKELELADAIQKIFGKVKFKNTEELNKIAKSLESLFSRKGLDNQTISDFLKRIGVDDAVFRAEEATRQIYAKELGANTMGLNIREAIQGLTSSVVTPAMVKNISIATGISQNIIRSISQYANPAGRAVILRYLIDELTENNEEIEE